MEPLRHFLQKQLGSDTSCMPLSHAISECYRRLLQNAHQTDTANPSSASFQEKLRGIAIEFVRRFREKCPN